MGLLVPVGNRNCVSHVESSLVPRPFYKTENRPADNVVRLETRPDLKKGTLITCIVPKLSVSNSHTSATRAYQAGHVTSVNGKFQNKVIYRTSLLLLATPDVREIRGACRLHDVA